MRTKDFLTVIGERIHQSFDLFEEPRVIAFDIFNAFGKVKHVELLRKTKGLWILKSCFGYNPIFLIRSTHQGSPEWRVF